MIFNIFDINCYKINIMSHIIKTVVCSFASLCILLFNLNTNKMVKKDHKILLYYIT